MNSEISTSTFPVVLQHLQACGVKDGRHVGVSILPVAALLLVARGADRIVIPAPHPDERDRAEAGIEGLPPERKGLVAVVDTKGRILNRVRDYLDPLKKQARKWPEEAVVGLGEDFLYEVLVATSERAGVLSNSVSIVRGFIPIIDPREFKGEARFRLAELCRLICSYEPGVIDHGMWVNSAGRDAGASAWDILRTAEYRSLVSASGRIGYLKHPLVAMQRLGEKVLALIRKPVVKPVLKLAASAADAAGGSGLGGVTKEALGIAAENRADQFHPPFISLGPLTLPLYREALAEGLPGATPPPGVIMLFEQLRGGHASHSWLGVGEELKLEQEAISEERQRRTDYLRARKALDRFVCAHIN